MTKGSFGHCSTNCLLLFFFKMDTASDCLFISTCIIRGFSLQLKYSDVNLHSSGMWAWAPNSSICAKIVTSPQCRVVKARFRADVLSSEGIHRKQKYHVCVCRRMCRHTYAGGPIIWLIPRISGTRIVTTILRPKHFIHEKPLSVSGLPFFFFFSFWYGFHLSWHIRWNVSQILWIYPTYPSGNGPGASVWRRKARLERWWGEPPACHSQANKSALFNQLQACYWCRRGR